MGYGSGRSVDFDPKGKHLGTILTGQRTANCAFGEDGSTLFITADMYLLRIRTTTKANGFDFLCFNIFVVLKKPNGRDDFSLRMIVVLIRKL